MARAGARPAAPPTESATGRHSPDAPRAASLGPRPSAANAPDAAGAVPLGACRAAQRVRRCAAGRAEPRRPGDPTACAESGPGIRATRLGPHPSGRRPPPVTGANPHHAPLEPAPPPTHHGPVLRHPVSIPARASDSARRQPRNTPPARPAAKATTASQAANTSSTNPTPTHHGPVLRRPALIPARVSDSVRRQPRSTPPTRPAAKATAASQTANTSSTNPTPDTPRAGTKASRLDTGPCVRQRAASTAKYPSHTLSRQGDNRFPNRQHLVDEPHPRHTTGRY